MLVLRSILDALRLVSNPRTTRDVVESLQSVPSTIRCGSTRVADIRIGWVFRRAVFCLREIHAPAVEQAPRSPLCAGCIELQVQLSSNSRADVSGLYQVIISTVVGTEAVWGAWCCKTHVRISWILVGAI